MSEEGKGGKGGKAREENQLKAFRYIPNNHEGHNHDGYRGSIVDIDRAYEISRLWIKGQPA